MHLDRIGRLQCRSLRGCSSVGSGRAPWSSQVPFAFGEDFGSASCKLDLGASHVERVAGRTQQGLSKVLTFRVSMTFSDLFVDSIDNGLAD